MMRDACRRLLSHVVMGLCGLSVLLALVPLAFILFYVVTQGITSLNWSFIATCRSRSANRAAAWPTRSSAR